MTVWARISEFGHTLGESLSHTIESFGVKSKAPEKSTVFTIAMIALGAKMAKADGLVTNEEVLAFSEVFHVPEKDRAAVNRVFNQAKQDVAGFETYAQQVVKLFGQKSHVLESVVDGLFHIAKADDILHPGELEFLQRVSSIFGFEGADWLRIRARHAAVKDDPFEVLGVAPDAKPATIKKHYKALVKELHPDMQIAAGVPEEMVRLSTDRLATINTAYAELERLGAV